MLTASQAIKYAMLTQVRTLVTASFIVIAYVVGSRGYCYPALYELILKVF